MAYRAQDFIDAIPGTGGVITVIARKVGCDWTTAKRYITDYPTVRRVWKEERSSINDKAEWNVVKTIVEDGDIPNSKWWLTLKHPEFKPKSEVDMKAEGEIVLRVSGIKPEDV